MRSHLWVPLTWVSLLANFTFVVQPDSPLSFEPNLHLQIYLMCTLYYGICISFLFLIFDCIGSAKGPYTSNHFI